MLLNACLLNVSKIRKECFNGRKKTILYAEAIESISLVTMLEDQNRLTEQNFAHFDYLLIITIENLAIPTVSNFERKYPTAKLDYFSPLDWSFRQSQMVERCRVIPNK